MCTRTKTKSINAKFRAARALSRDLGTLESINKFTKICSSTDVLTQAATNLIRASPTLSFTLEVCTPKNDLLSATSVREDSLQRVTSKSTRGSI